MHVHVTQWCNSLFYSSWISVSGGFTLPVNGLVCRIMSEYLGQGEFENSRMQILKLISASKILLHLIVCSYNGCVNTSRDSYYFYCTLVKEKIRCLEELWESK